MWLRFINIDLLLGREAVMRLLYMYRSKQDGVQNCVGI